ncbi:MAG TPA: hypothetical protein VJR92_15220 [Gemmatimonadaceae bacterium]|nr:hypothetical protein [Gemmatimonadaceae bacterium]
MRISRIKDEVYGTHLDTIVDSWNTLEPRSHRSTGTRPGANLKFQLEWSGDRVRGRIDAQGMAPFTVDQRMPSLVYNSASMDLVLRAAPLASGYSISVPVYTPGRGVTEFTAVVADEEFVAGQLVWRIEADFGGADHTFWVAKASRAVLKQNFRLDATTEIEFIFLGTGRR